MIKSASYMWVICVVLCLASIGHVSAWVNTTGGDHEGADWTVNDSDTISGTHYNIGDFTITSGYTVNINTSTALSITAERIIIDGILNGNETGDPSGTGNGGAGGASGGGGGGAGYGGVGGAGGAGGGVPGTAGIVYGSNNDVSINMGSKGGTGQGTGGAGGPGGGSISLYAATISISGAVYLNGDIGDSCGGITDGGGGGGSGGGLLISGQVVNLSGIISANGGNGGNAGGATSGGGGGAGGGRIKVFYIEYTNTSTMTVSAGAGGTGTTGNGVAGSSGTIYTMFDTTNLTIYAPYGYVYGVDGTTPISGATVNISNTTWSQVLTTSALGYWSATELSTTGIYNHTVSKQYRVNDDGAVYISATATNNTNFILELEPPELYTPTNNTEINSSFPPLTYDTIFTWEDTGAYGYKIDIAEDESFNKLVLTDTVTSATVTKNLILDVEYFWRVSGYDGDVYGEPSGTYSFELNGTTSLSGSAIEGVIYTGDVGAYESISSAQVHITNGSWSDSTITGTSGYYQFTDLKVGEVYSLYSTKDLYLSSSYVYVNVTTSPTTQNFYLEEDVTSQEWAHYVSFTLQNFWGTKYSGVDTTVYIGDAVTASDSGETESDGVVVFELDQNVQYRLTFIDASQGINQEFIVYPISTKYTIYVTGSTEPIPPTPVTDVLTAKVEGVRINSTDGYINFTWSDISAETSTIYYWINDTDGNILYSTSETTINMTNSQIVDATNDRYIVHWIGTHPVIGNVEHVQTIAFHGGRRVDLGWTDDWMYAITSFAVLIFLGTMFGAKTAHYGAISVVMFGWFFVWIGWFTSDNTSILLIILATVITFGWAMRKGEVVKP